MSLADDIQALLQDLKPLYEVCRAMQPEWIDLQSIDAAYNEYHAAEVAAEQHWDLDGWRTRESQRLRDKNALLDQSDPIDTGTFHIDPTLIINPNHRPPDDTKVDPGSASARSDLPDLAAIRTARSELKRLVLGMAGPWQLGSRLGLINRIVGNQEQPLGEALILLEWSAYEQRAGKREDEAAHKRRLEQWREALKEYHAWLPRQIDSQRSKYPGFGDIFQVWLARGREQADGRARWEALLAKLDEDKRAEADRIDQRIRQLDADIARLKIEAAARQARSTQ